MKADAKLGSPPRSVRLFSSCAKLANRWRCHGKTATQMDAKSVIAVATFSVSSSGLLLINKLCLKEVALPSFLAVLQFVASVLCALGLAATGQAELDGLAWPRVRIYLMYIGLFATAIYSNMQALTHSNVETLIVFRACGPLMVSLLEWRLLGRTLPSRRSVLALFGIFLFALGYVASDKAFGAPARSAHAPHRTPAASSSHLPAPHPPPPLPAAVCSHAAMHGLRAYSWCAVYFISICLSDTCGKHLISGLQWRSMWGPVLYTNLLATPVMCMCAAPHPPHTTHTPHTSHGASRPPLARRNDAARHATPRGAAACCAVRRPAVRCGGLPPRLGRGGSGGRARARA